MRKIYTYWASFVVFLCLNLTAGECADDIKRDAFTYTATMLDILYNLESPEVGFLPVSFIKSLESGRALTSSKVLSCSLIRRAKQKFQYFCRNFDKTAGSETISDDLCFSIPPIIHLIWLGSYPPSAVDIAIDSWRRYHPEWEIRLWTDEDVKNFLWFFPRSKDLFLKGENWAEKSDILRFEILYQLGGIYTDIDVICLKSFQDLVTKGLSAFAGFENNNETKLDGGPLLGSAIIGAARNSTVIKRCIDYTYSPDENDGSLQYVRSGPGPLTKAFLEALKDNMQTVLVLPCSYFYPLPWCERLLSFNELTSKIRNESFAIHFWEFSWEQ